MADLKISQLTDGGASQAADEYVVARSGANYRIDGASVAAAATSVGTLTSLTVSGDLTVDTSTLKVDSTNNRVGVGTTSPIGSLDVVTSATSQFARLRTTSSASTNVGLRIQDGTTGTTDADGIYLGRASAINYLWTYENEPWTFGTNNTERARITSGGYFKASSNGTYVSSTGLYHELRSADNAAGLVVTNTSTSYTDDLIYGNVTTAAGTGFKLMRLDSNSVEQFRVRGDGTIFAQNTTVQSLSDVRLKENISDAAEGLAVITALRPVRYDWKAGYGNDRKNQLGFVAQEMEAVFPEAVSVWEMDEPTGEVDEDGKPITEKVDYKTVGPGALIPVLVKAIQELEARIAVLEAGA